MQPRPGHERREPLRELQRAHHQVRGAEPGHKQSGGLYVPGEGPGHRPGAACRAVAPRGLELELHPAGGVEPDYHGDDDDFAHGGVIRDSQKRKKYEPRRPLALDIDDLIDPTTREWITVDETGNMVFPEASEQRAAELGARFEAWLLQRTDLGAGEKSWLRMAVHQLRAIAAHYTGPDAEISLDQFAFHPFSQLGGLAQAARVFGRSERLAEVAASLNEHLLGGTTDADPARDAAAAPPPAAH